jgi:predicted Zn finger-like uncharacterized protein
MEIICESCKARLNIPDEKIPQDKRVTISCPKCKNKLSLETHGLRQGDHVPSAEGMAEPRIVEADSDYAYGDEDADLELYEEGVRLALVMENDAQQAEKLSQAVEELGYKYVPAENTRAAIGKMRLHQFDLVILADGFDGIELGQSPVLRYLNHLSMSIRRRIFVALIGDSFKTMDQMMAFVMSANLVINPRDMDKLRTILIHSISDNEKFYKVFMDTLVEVG